MKRYPGLSPFSIEQKESFYGRDIDIKELCELIFIERKVLLYSKSGYGKTSLLNAGVIPKLRKFEDFEVVKIRFHSYLEGGISPSITFLQTLKKISDFEKIDCEKTIIDGIVGENHNTFWTVFKKNQLLGNRHKTYVLIFDQFEELFSYKEDHINEFKNQFAEIINIGKLPNFFQEIEEYVFKNKESFNFEEIELLYDNINIKAVFSVRADYLSKLNNLADEIIDIQKVFYKLKPLNEIQAKQAIENPAKLIGNFDCPAFNYEPEAIKIIISALTNNGKQKIETTILQIICQHVEGDITTNPRLYVSADDMPVLDNIYIDFYKKALAAVKENFQDHVRDLIEDDLIHDQQRISLDRRKIALPEVELQKLIAIHLIRAEPNTTGSLSYELAHDKLVLPILEERKLRIEKNENEEKIKAISEKAEKDRIKYEEKRKRLRTSIIITSIFAISFLLLSLWINKLRKEAKRQTKIAQKEKEIADSLRKNAEYLYKQLTTAKFDKYYTQAEALANANNYLESIKTLERARYFTADTVEIDKLIIEYNDKFSKDIKFNEFIKQGDIYARPNSEATWLKARFIYQNAKSLNYNNSLAQKRVDDINSNIDARLEIYKNRTEKYLKLGLKKDNILESSIKPAIQICDKSHRHYNFFMEKKNECEK